MGGWDRCRSPCAPGALYSPRGDAACAALADGAWLVWRKAALALTGGARPPLNGRERCGMQATSSCFFSRRRFRSPHLLVPDAHTFNFVESLPQSRLRGRRRGALRALGAHLRGRGRAAGPRARHALPRLPPRGRHHRGRALRQRVAGGQALGVGAHRDQHLLWCAATRRGWGRGNGLVGGSLPPLFLVRRASTGTPHNHSTRELMVPLPPPPPPRCRPIIRHRRLHVARLLPLLFRRRLHQHGHPTREADGKRAAHPRFLKRRRSWHVYCIACELCPFDAVTVPWSFRHTHQPLTLCASFCPPPLSPFRRLAGAAQLARPCDARRGGAVAGVHRLGGASSGWVGGWGVSSDGGVHGTVCRPSFGPCFISR